MELNYHIYLLERFSSVNITRIQEFIEKFVDMNSIKDVSKQMTEGEIIYFIRLETNMFEDLASRVQNHFEYELAEYTMFLHNHYHIERWTDSMEIIHAAIAYQVSDTVWEFYYQDGTFDVEEKIGTVEDEVCFLYKLELDSSQENREEALEKSFDDWISTFFK